MLGSLKGSLQTKVIISIFILLVLALGISTYLNLRQKEKAFRAKVFMEIQNMNTILCSALQNSMLNNDREGLRKMIDKIGGADVVKRIYITNPDGVIYISSGKDLSGRIDMDSFNAVFQPKGDSIEFMETSEGDPFVVGVTPVLAEPACIKCHATIAVGEPIGFLGMERWAVRDKEELGITLQNSLIMGLSTIIVCSALLALLMRRLVTKPIQVLRQSSERIGCGELDYRINLKTGDEIEGLAIEFNRMAEKLADSYGSLERKVKDQTESLREEIAERKRVNEQLADTNRKLKELESMKEDLISMVVHDMKNPVSNSILALDVIAYGNEATLNEEQVDFLKVAKRNQFVLSEMITNLLDISRIESGKLQIKNAAMDMLELAQRIVERHATMAEKEAKSIVLSVDPQAQRIVSDERLIERTLANLLSNAVKHSYPGGEIRVEILPVSKHNGIEVSVSDFGEGIPTEFHAKIFEKYSQADKRKLGKRNDTGLGLAFCKIAVEALGGSISVKSEKDKGSKFTFHLPDVFIMT